ncbi:MAG: methyltransferase domain-containing protein [Azoarcus sp.]|jgi:malonyl-CoA O-methyltransferase|nr:methyltransferase domain-containing protein [Azoarcus sp.]
MTDTRPAAFDARKHAVRRAFERAASTYDAAAHVQRETAQRLFAFAGGYPPEAPVRRMLDAGCGTGRSTRALVARFPGALCLALDFSTAMLGRARTVWGAAQVVPLAADIERLPLAANSIDLYWSSLALQWCEPEAALTEAARVLVPGGAAWIATLGPRTLNELRTAFAAVDDDAHTIEFRSLSDWCDASRHTGLTVTAQADETLFDFASDLRALIGNIKAIGARTVFDARRRRTLGRRGWQTLQSAYEAFRSSDGLLPTTYDLILLALRKPA